MKLRLHFRGWIPLVLVGTMVLSSFSISAHASNPVATTTSTRSIATSDASNVCAPTFQERNMLATPYSPDAASSTAQFASDDVNNLGNVSQSKAPTPVSLMLDTLSDTTLYEGEQQQVHLTQLYSDGSTIDVTKFAKWSFYDENIANVTVTETVYGIGEAVLHARSVGDTVITATYNSEAGVPFFVTVFPKMLPDETLSVTLLEENVKMKVGTSKEMLAIRSDLNGIRKDVTTQGQWTSLDPSVVSVTPDGIIQAKQLGKTYIYFKYDGLTATALVGVVEANGLSTNEPSVELLPSDQFILVAYSELSDGTQTDVSEMAAWTVKDPEIATVENGVVNAVSVGTTEITISYDSHTYQVPVTVTNNLRNPVLLGLDINPPSLTLDMGEKSKPMKVTGIYSNGTTKDLTDQGIEWRTGNIVVSMEDNSAVANAGGSGPSIISATIENRTAYVPVYVKQDPNTPPIETHIFTSLNVTPDVKTLQVNATQEIQVEAIYNFGSDIAKNKDVTQMSTYTSLNPDIVSVSPAGAITALKEGSATITISAFSLTKYLTITVTPGAPKAAAVSKQLTSIVPSASKVRLDLAKGAQQLTAQARYSDGSSEDATKASIWTSLNPGIVQVNDGVLTPVRSGTTQVLVHEGNSTALVEISIGDEGAVQTSSSVHAFYRTSEAIIQKNGIIPARLQAALDDGRIVDVTESNGTLGSELAPTVWRTDEPTIATVHAGMIKGLELGQTTVTVKYGDYPTIRIPVTVQSSAGPTTILGLWVNDLDVRVYEPNTEVPAHPAYVQFSNNQVVEANDVGDWCTTDPSVVTVDDHGNLKTTGLGEAYVKFMIDDPNTGTHLNDQMYVRVNKPSSLSYYGDADNVNIPVNSEYRPTIFAFFPDDPRHPFTVEDNGVWRSSDDSVVTATDAGLILAQSPGKATLTFSYMGLTLDLHVIVGEAVVSGVISIFATPSYVIQKVGGTVKPTITAMYIDGKIEDVSSKVRWLETSPSVANVSSNVIAANSTGAAVVGAEYGGAIVAIPVVVKGARTTGNDSNDSNDPTAPTAPVSSTVPEKPAIPVVPEASKLSFIDGVNATVLKSNIEQALKNTTKVTYSDLSDQSWSASAITLASHIGFVQGYSDGSFQPKANVTRAEFATMLAHALGVTGKSGALFSDVSDTSFAADSIRTLQAMGLIDGYDNGTFRPDQVISRAEIASILAKAVKISKSSGVGQFTDVDGHWAADAINALGEQGIIEGKSTQLFEPNSNTTREESVVLILRTLGKVLDLDLKL